MRNLLVVVVGLVLSANVGAQGMRGQCTQECGGVRGGCAANTKEAQICFNRCMGTQECPVAPVATEQLPKSVQPPVKTQPPASSPR